MKHRVIKASEVDACPLHIMSADHWIPEHRTEQCDPMKRRVMDAYDDAQRRDRAEFRELQKRARIMFGEVLRRRV